MYKLQAALEVAILILAVDGYNEGFVSHISHWKFLILGLKNGPDSPSIAQHIALKAANMTTEI